MAYNEQLAARIRKRFANLPDVEEKKMMGGLTFMYKNKMCMGIFKDDLMCRIDPALQDELLKKGGCRVMEFSGRKMNGFLLVSESAVSSSRDFNHWIDLCLAFNPKAKSSKKK